jgi:hypothetical protein
LKSEVGSLTEGKREKVKGKSADGVGRY